MSGLPMSSNAKRSLPEDNVEAITTPTKGRRKHVSEALGEQVADEREVIMLQDINDYLKKNPDTIPDFWHLVKQNKLKKKSSAKGKPKNLDLPTSTNKLNLISKDRLELILQHLEKDISPEVLKNMLKSRLVQLLAWALHMEEDSAVPSKVWDELLDTSSSLYVHYGSRLKDLTFVIDTAGDAGSVPDYGKKGTYSLVKSESGDKYRGIQHWCGLEAALEEELDLSFHLSDNHDEHAAKVVSDTMKSRMYMCEQVFQLDGQWLKLPARLKLDKVGGEVHMVAWQRMLTDAPQASPIQDTNESAAGASLEHNNEHQETVVDDEVPPAGYGGTSN